MAFSYYNEHDPFAAAWLRELIKDGHITDGEVDERSIEDVTPGELAGFTQCHFFAGIGGWSLALRQAGWPDDKPVWTGSCPCQPFSSAGKREGATDERHLWPAFFHLISQRRPDTLFGEQVEAAIKHGWLDLVQADMEGIGYAFGAASVAACAVGAQHIRKRLWFVADTNNQHGGGEFKQRLSKAARTWQQPDGNSATGDVANSVYQRLQGRLSGRENPGWEAQHGRAGCDCTVGDLAYAASERRGKARPGDRRSPQRAGDSSEFSELGDTASDQCAGSGEAGETEERQGKRSCIAGQLSNGSEGLGFAGGFWNESEWIYCRDGKFRAAQPEIFPLAHGVPNRVGMLRGSGNAIVPQVAQAFIESYLKARS